MRPDEATVKPAAASGPPPTLSVVLPNYNHGDRIARALYALLNQTPLASEIIVIDDGSTDDSVAVVEALQRHHASIKLIRSPMNQGIIASVKTGLAAATGDYLLFAASDDLVLPGLFNHAFTALSAYPKAAFFCAGVALLDIKDRVIGVRPVTVPRHGPGYLSPDDVRRVIRDSDFWVLGTATVYRRRLLAEIGYFDANLGSLGDVLANRLLAFQHGFYFDPAVLAAYNKDPTSFSARNALSVSESRRLLNSASSWIAANLPEDVRDEHGRLFDRRMRFALARLWVIWRNGRMDADSIADILDAVPFDRVVLRSLARASFGSGLLTLGWMTLRMPPFSVTAMLQAWWRAQWFKWFGRGAVEEKVAAVNGFGGATTAVRNRAAD
jgi:glycosyltransferase involved in cell wall biosynthesis